MAMRTYRGFVALLTVVLVTGLAAQPRGGGNHPGNGGERPGNTAGSGAQSTAPAKGSSGIGATQIHLRPGWGLAPASPFGNIANPGGVSNHPQPNFLQPNPIIQPRPNVIQPFGQSPYRPIAPEFSRSRYRTVYVPVYYGNGYGLGYGYPDSGQPQTETIYVDTSGPGTGNGPGVWGGSQAPVTVNNYIYTVAPEPKPVPEAKPVTLLVFKNHSIYAVSDYWVDDGRVHYITSYGAQDSASTDQLDMDFTRKLNDERSVKFELKPKS